MKNVDVRQLGQFRDALRAMAKDTDAIMEELLVGEGVYAVKEAKRLCQADDVIDTGNYRNGFHADKTARRIGKTYRIAFYNNSSYAKPLEYGFRSHFVPAVHLSAKWRSRFPNGMYVGPKDGFVPGHYVMERAKAQTQKSQDRRLKKKLDAILKRYLGGTAG